MCHEDYNVRTPAEVDAERKAKTEKDKREKAQQKLDAEMRQNPRANAEKPRVRKPSRRS